MRNQHKEQCPRCEHPISLCECLHKNTRNATCQHITPKHWMAQTFPDSINQWAVIVRNHDQQGHKNNHVVTYTNQAQAEAATNALNTFDQNPLYALIATNGMVLATSLNKYILQATAKPNQQIKTFDNHQALTTYIEQITSRN